MSDAPIRTAYIGLGSNVASGAGTPAETLLAALRALTACGEVSAHSSLYETAPVGFTDQPLFVNAAAAVRTEDSPEIVLQKILEIERRFGRDRDNSPPKGPRTLDLDLLLVDEMVVNTPSLTLPHPALAERRFVLAPLVEIAPGLMHPRLGKTMHELLLALPDEGDNSAASVRILKRSVK
jgi:2-amino-4-hydroxy-6-hydroxymethyldihydropteridine diphosphokinase